MPPQPSEDHYERQRRLAAIAAREARNSGNNARLGRMLGVLQYAAAAEADTYLNTFDPEPAGTIQPLAFTGVAGDGRPLLTLLRQAESRASLQVMAATAVQDAGRAAVSAGITARPTLTGYVRMLTAPSCSRCAVLAGRWFKWNAGFQRHPFVIAGTCRQPRMPPGI